MCLEYYTPFGKLHVELSAFGLCYLVTFFYSNSKTLVLHWVVAKTKILIAWLSFGVYFKFVNSCINCKLCFSTTLSL